MLLKEGARRHNPERLFLCLLRYFLLLTIPCTALADNACSSSYYDETTTIRYIYDGDTLQLRDGTKVRLIGINTPELGYGKKKTEPYATEAKNALEALFKDKKTIKLRYGKEKNDHYGRFLAHGFLANGQNIQTLLLQQGLARAITIPPNTQFAGCYFKQEQQAHCDKKGIWSKQQSLQAKNLKKRDTGFHLIHGRVTNIRFTHRGIWLDIDHKLTIGIRPDNLALFDIKTIKRMANQYIIARGWLNKSNKSTPFYMRVRHPMSIQLASSFACATTDEENNANEVRAKSNNTAKRTLNH